MSDLPDIPIIGVTMGDPLGIGPEVVVKALADPELHARARFVVYGRNEMLTLAADRADIRPYWYRVAQGSDRAQGELMPPVTVVDFDVQAVLACQHLTVDILYEACCLK